MYSSEQLKDWKRKANFATFGSCLIHVILGSFYSWGNLNIYIVSYYKNLYPESYDYLNPNIMAFVFPFMGFLIFATTPFGISLGNALGFSLASFLLTVFLSISLFISAFMPSFWLFLIFYAIIPGLLMGFLSSLSIYVVLKYKISKNYMNGLMMLFYGIGTAITNFLAYLIINPSNNQGSCPKNDGYFYFSKNTTESVPHFLLFLGVFYIVIGILGSNFMKVPEFDSFVQEPVNIEMQKGLESEEEKLEYVYAQTENERDNEKRYYIGLQETETNSQFYNMKSVLKSWKFYNMFLLIFFASPFGFFMANYYKIIGMKTVNNDLTFVIIGSISGLFNGFARFLTPLIMKKRVTFKILFLVLACIQLIIIPTFFLIVENAYLFAIWSSVALFCQGGIYAMFPKATYNSFGKNLWSVSYTFMLFSFVLANFLHYGISSLFLDLVGLENLLWIYFAFCAAGIVLGFVFKEESE